jgi:hypothetical protein
MATTFIVAALILASIFALGFYFRYRTRADAQATVRAALEKGQPLSTETLDRLMDPVARKLNRREVDFRRGAILVALGVGIAVIGYAIMPTLREALAIAALPFTVGVAYVLLWKFSPGA